MTTPFGMPTFVKVGKKKTPKQLGAPGTVRPPTASGRPGSVRDNPSVDSRSVSGTVHEVNMPGTFSAGDLLVHVGCLRNQGSDPGITAPSGWSTLLDDGDTSNPWGVCFYKVATGSETDTTYTSSNPTAIQGAAGVTFAVAPPDSFDTWSLAAASLSQAGSSTTDVTFNQIPISADGQYLVIGAALSLNDLGNFDITDFAGQTLIGTTPTGNNDPKVTVGEEDVVTSTGYTPSTWTADQAQAGQFGFAFYIFTGDTAQVSAPGHTHTESDISDLDHWTETDHDALDHTGLTGIPAAVSQVLTFAKSGTLEVTTGVSKFPAPFAMTLVGVRAAVGTAPTGASLIVDVNKNGTTVYTTQANRPTISASSTSSTETAPDVTAVAAGDLISVDIDQVGSTVAGSDLVVAVEYTA